jgi:hypothetical protein
MFSLFLTKQYRYMLLQITTPHTGRYRDVTLALPTLDRHPSPLYLCRLNRYNQHHFTLCNLLKLYIQVQFNRLPEFRWCIHKYMSGGRTAAVASNLMVLHPGSRHRGARATGCGDTPFTFFPTFAPTTLICKF